ncbi:FGGY carbohydrate kinase domain-containing protein [Nymphon striatum]|nr:FGGY carbohydrate kinase domain-containing protein [Nymphon striatum]
MDKSEIRGIGFDATCSLVVLDENENSVTVSPDGDPNQNVVMWMDHRAKDEADFITQVNHPILKYVGGKISLEMQPPKLLWLKKNLYDSCWKHARYFFDLPDFMTFKATGSLTRSLCSTICKWLYVFDEVKNEVKPVDSFWQQINLEDIVDNNYSRTGSEICFPGDSCGKGLTVKAAKAFGLNPGTAVATSMIDAHAGAVALLSCSTDVCAENISSRLAVICGTSSCHMASSNKAMYTNGVWGPYFSAVVQGYFLNEGGQSATGKLLDYVIENHTAFKELCEKAEHEKCHIHEKLNSILENLMHQKNLQNTTLLTKNIHIWPDFHGNRSPIADPNLKGMISGLTLDTSLENMAVIYLATMQAIGYGTRHIIEALKSDGHSFQCVVMCGGLSKNNIFVQLQADIIGLPVYIPHETESVLLGSAILGAAASEDFKTLIDAMKSMGGLATKISPRTTERRFNEKKYKVFLKMLQDQREYDEIMSEI